MSEELDFDKPLQLIRPGAKPAPVRVVKCGFHGEGCTNFGNRVVEFQSDGDWFVIVEAK